ncbi:hypothetical protein [Amphritea balenae]|uniref:Glycosyltransferase RgtA/B/C/D-like domain-containing protein n=1 Tax=Amphritea balenae TaxID=452629 RepID=A0A3P1SP16_9GAMM|nr:hypothetical protein [Amphritea balenae]RRC98991.1 hypothetical protein EHS89_12550 [Amphritea balenae]
MALASMATTYWLWSQPAALGSDDAFYFSNGIEHFSVLEFSPHFPGYPAFISLARLASLFLDDATQALISTTRLAALLIPWLSYALLRASGCQQSYAAVGFLLCAGQPLLLGLGLQGLSDSAGLIWLLALLLTLQRNHLYLAGLMLGLLLATRPSYAPLIVAPLCWILYLEPRRLLQLLPGGLIIGLLSLGFVLYHDSSAYFYEGWRFIQGHFQLWGNSSLGTVQSGSWSESLTDYFGSCLALVVLAIPVLWLIWRQRTPETILLLVTFIFSLVWTLGAQNPLNLRHMAPSLILLICLLCIALSRLHIRKLSIILSIFLFTGGLIQTLSLMEWQPKQPPLQQARIWLEQQSTGQLATNYGVDLLRHQLPTFAVADTYYPGASKRVLQSGGWRLSATQLNDDSLVMKQQFSARFPGEQSLWIYQYKIDIY